MAAVEVANSNNQRKGVQHLVEGRLSLDHFVESVLLHASKPGFREHPPDLLNGDFSLKRVSNGTLDEEQFENAGSSVVARTGA